MSAPVVTLPVLSWAHAELEASPANTVPVLARLNAILGQTRAALSVDAWSALITRCRQHPVCARLLEDPLTRRSFTKPRGYAGDAELLDIIYARDWRGVCAEPPTELGETIFRHTIDCQAPAAVRHRRQLLAAMIDEMSGCRPAATMMSVACGHLRELRLSTAMQQGRVGRFVGLDQDRASLAVVEEEWPESAVETITGSVKSLWSPELRDRRFDFIYTAGLYDYLEEKFAQRLTRRMYEMLRPGGRLLVANYHPSVNDIGYMETFMDWRLIYRDHAAMERLAAGLPEKDLAGQRIFPDRTGAVLYLQMERPA